MSNFVIFGAELQAAISFARAFEKYKIYFVSEEKVLAGRDLKNVIIKTISIEEASKLDWSSYGELIYADEKWVNIGKNKTILENYITSLYKKDDKTVLPIFTNINSLISNYILKGTISHKKDSIELINENDLENKEIQNIAYQTYKKNIKSNIQVQVYKNKKSGVCILLMDVLKASFGREEFFIAGETIQDKFIIDKTKEYIDLLEFTNFLYFNWIITENNSYYLTSVRPIIKPFFQAFKYFGTWDYINNIKNTIVLDKNLKLVTKQFYGEY